MRNSSFGTVAIKGHLTIIDPNTNEIILDKDNSVHYENFSKALADSIASKGVGSIYFMAFGNGGTKTGVSGDISYLPPNTTGQNAELYNQTYRKIVDDTSVFNTDPANNKMTVVHTIGNNYTDILVQCLLDYGEPSGQAAFDNTTNTTDYSFDEIGLQANYGGGDSANPLTQLLTHVIFHPIEKSGNRQLQINYTVRINSVSNIIAGI